MDEVLVSVCLLSSLSSAEQILVELWWHVYQNEGNVDQNESYLAEVRIHSFTVKVSMRNSSNRTGNINKHG